MKPTALIIRTAGTNCDIELAHAFELAGASTVTYHLNQLIENPAIIEQQADIVGFPGGFSYGDDIAAGRIFANRLKHQLWAQLHDAVKRGVPMIGICNGFQVLVKLGLLPDPQAGQCATLADNTQGRFIDRWCKVQTPKKNICIWTQNLTDYDLPIAHGEGRFVPASNDLLEQWQQQGQIALRYAPNDNPNGSTDDIAGICDPTGLILGLMPHPERFTHLTHHPQWTRWNAEQKSQTPVGLQYFKNAVQYVITKKSHTNPAIQNNANCV